MTTWAIKLAILVLAALCSVGAACAQDQYGAIRADIEREIAAGRATGVAVALTHKGKIIWQEGFGWADKERGRRVTPHTPFSLASVTKPFTTTALMVLVAMGEVSLDARANDYLGAAKIRAGVGNPDAVTVRALASHSSGLPGTFQIFPAGGALKQPSMDEVIRNYGVLVSPPNERFAYSNVGMGIVAHIASRKSGLEYGVLLRDKVLAPLGLEHSFFDTDVSRHGEMAQRYDREGNAFPFYVTSTPVWSGSGTRSLERWSRTGSGSPWLPRLRSRCRKRIAVRGAARCAMVRTRSRSFCPLPARNRVCRSAGRRPSRSRS